MLHKVTVIANAIVGTGLLATAVILSMVSHDPSASAIAGPAGAAFLALAAAVSANRRLLVHVIAVPLLLLLCALLFLLMFAPLAWGRGNQLDAWVLQGLVVVMAALQVASLVAVRKREQ